MLALIIYVLWCITPGESLSYPVFGTKRYHRASGSSFIPSSSSSSSYPSTPYVIPQYYDQEQQPFISPSYDHNGYVSGNGYYYYPRHAYHSYGLPTYRGEYKPTPYYYAPGPSYSYYDDRDIAPNPLDDLHEEILQEDERERQREMIPVGQESWYDNSRHHDDLTNNFLRNLIAYNRELDAEQLQQQQQQQQQQQEKQQQEKQKQQQLQQQQLQQEQLQQQKQHQQQVLQQQHNVYREQPKEYDDYSEINSDYEYDQQDESLYDLKKNENPQHQHNSYNEMEDEDERQLKSLARASEDQSNKNHVEGNIQENNYNNWQHSPSAYAQYDTDPEYDDAWTTWDRKRSRPSKVSSKRDESIKDFNDRKTFPFVKYLGTTESTTIPIISASVQPFESSATTLRSKNTENSGQKEIVLPRPSTPVQHMFAQPVFDIIGSALKTDIVQRDEEKRSNDDNKASNVYDTIKELITMQEHLGKSYENSKFQKRFVSSEESLVHELNSLKRQSQ